MSEGEASNDKCMRHIKVVVPWQDGLHFRPAAKLVRTAKGFRSKIFLKCGGKMADLRSILSIVSLCATMGTALDVMAAGDDESDATRAVEQVFSSHSGNAAGSVSQQEM